MPHGRGGRRSNEEQGMAWTIKRSWTRIASSPTIGSESWLSCVEATARRDCHGAGRQAAARAEWASCEEAVFAGFRAPRPCGNWIKKDRSSLTRRGLTHGCLHTRPGSLGAHMLVVKTIRSGKGIRVQTHGLAARPLVLMVDRTGNWWRRTNVRTACRRGISVSLRTEKPLLAEEATGGHRT